ncbi:MAG TPA: ClbS/DfsB family four-helix bundle protein [Anaerolineae bacterium]|nr:ClbS/DfsB family four-helix bundle protein [Anaerolineae bacterium]HMR68360.1 ClbS/DfsB family four-helix bundle protein [Anaerolineae bacterium]
MSKRANAIAERIEQGGEALATFTESLSEADWQAFVPNEDRTVGALVHHVAGFCVPLVDWAKGVAAGKPISGVTWDDIAQMNAQHAQEYAIVDKKETLEMLRTNTKAAADKVREFTDEELDTAAPVCLYWDTPLSAQFFIEFHSVRHNYNHLDSIKAAFNR